MRTDFVYPSYSPDLTPLDAYDWSMRLLFLKV